MERLIPKKKDFISETINALLSIERPLIPIFVEKYATEHSLVEKPEFHISVIATKNGKIISDFLKEHPEALEIKEKIKNLFEFYEWKYVLKSEYYFMNKFYTEEDLEKSGHKDIPPQNRSTLVQGIDMPDLEIFYKELQNVTGISFDMANPHITLYSGSDYEPMKNRGIGIYSEKDFTDYMVEKITE